METLIKRRNRRNYSNKKLIEVELQERLFYFLRFEPICELKDEPLFHSVKELAVYFLEDIKNNPNKKDINSAINTLRYKIGLRPLLGEEKIEQFKKELFDISFKKAQIICGSNDLKCNQCPLKGSFRDRFNRRFKAVYPNKPVEKVNAS